MTEPAELVLSSELVTPDIAKEVVVAWVVVARVVTVSVRPRRIARLFRVVVAARLVSNLVSKRPLKVVVYTPLVTVPALPLIEPVMVFPNVLLPEKVLSLARRVEEAAVMVMSADPLKAVPLIFLEV
jgi:hypothetical protein